MAQPDARIKKRADEICHDGVIEAPNIRTNRLQSALNYLWDKTHASYANLVSNSPTITGDGISLVHVVDLVFSGECPIPTSRSKHM